jgi:hypothetical protein
MTRADPLPCLAGVAAAAARPGQPEAVFAALREATGTAIGHVLFTVLLADPVRNESQRVYSSHPAEYPVGGRKPITDSEWFRIIRDRGEVWIGSTYEDVRWAFFDHELIRSLGCESAMNVPVRWSGRTWGTLNLLHRAGWYRPEDAATGQLFAAMATPALLELSQRSA